MKIEHIAIWVQDLEKMKAYFMKYFELKCNDKYINEKKGFSSYFLSFESGARLEIMHRSDIAPYLGVKGLLNGLTHFAIAVGSKERVLELTELHRSDGYAIIGEPRTTGDGYFESVVGDPEGNLIEITI